MPESSAAPHTPLSKLQAPTKSYSAKMPTLTRTPSARAAAPAATSRTPHPQKSIYSSHSVATGILQARTPMAQKVSTLYKTPLTASRTPSTNTEKNTVAASASRRLFATPVSRTNTQMASKSRTVDCARTSVRRSILTLKNSKTSQDSPSTKMFRNLFASGSSGTKIPIRTEHLRKDLSKTEQVTRTKTLIDLKKKRLSRRSSGFKGLDEESCILMTPSLMRKLLSSTHKTDSIVKDKQDEEEEEEVKVHAVKPSTLLKYLFKEKHSAKMMEDFIPRSPQVLVTGVVLNDTNGQAPLDDANASQKAAAQTDEAPQSKSIEELKVEVEKQKNEPTKVEESQAEPEVAQMEDASNEKNKIVEIGLTEESVINNDKEVLEEVSQTSQEANMGSTQHPSELETENSELKNSSDAMIVEQTSFQPELIEQMEVAVTVETTVEAPVSIECEKNINTENMVETVTIETSIESHEVSPSKNAMIEETASKSVNIDSEVVQIETNEATEIPDQNKEEESIKESQIIIDEKLEVSTNIVEAPQESKVEDIVEKIEEAAQTDHEAESQVIEAVQQPEESIVQEIVEEQKKNTESISVEQSEITNELQEESQVIEPAITIAQDSVDSKIEQVTEEPSVNEPIKVDLPEEIEQVNVIQPVETATEAVVEEQSIIESKEVEQCEMIEAQSIEVQTENFSDEEEHEVELSTRDQADNTVNKEVNDTRLTSEPTGEKVEIEEVKTSDSVVPQEMVEETHEEEETSVRNTRQKRAKPEQELEATPGPKPKRVYKSKKAVEEVAEPESEPVVVEAVEAAKPKRGRKKVVEEPLPESTRPKRGGKKVVVEEINEEEEETSEPEEPVQVATKSKRVYKSKKAVETEITQPEPIEVEVKLKRGGRGKKAVELKEEAAVQEEPEVKEVAVKPKRVYKSKKAAEEMPEAENVKPKRGSKNKKPAESLSSEEEEQVEEVEAPDAKKSKRTYKKKEATVAEPAEPVPKMLTRNQRATRRN